ncbi:pyridoxamine 5'-phosphate oxidase family protein [Helicobacter mustelae]|uniref:Pyridoxamine 5'-phosphate oxidase putative domain-containing protein n=1 Tax=Helicobacter mustelae (strain ATCC 43772 / CCUG 25715 / CIP 103759 / LMG 18044 / NCTC 12198 / R85-136P) TaxID=679897 RepID=D3UGH1_HELM1|nr:hypothetical protein [Helicobacter mustelae]CBG39592.1 Putative hypothetical protein [Helicobacter mustelae 12198]SQH71103.1 Uncharacterized protein conserved in bacteria [Helicobacter mustelae]STP12232.1 Uncharacterized protein conserved in bacteria [Helicobacter mustelae]
MHQKMLEFLQREHLLTLSVCDVQGVYSASCFYCFFKEGYTLVCKSQESSRHIQLARKNPFVGVNIAHHTKKIQEISGMQIKALLRHAKEQETGCYHAKYPFARLGGGEVYALEILWAKYTDNSLLIPKKLEYRREICYTSPKKE